MTDPVFRHCALCADRIGVYEPVWWERPDGSLIATGLRAIEHQIAAGAAELRIFHRDCVPADPDGRPLLAREVQAAQDGGRS